MTVASLLSLRFWASTQSVSGAPRAVDAVEPDTVFLSGRLPPTLPGFTRLQDGVTYTAAPPRPSSANQEAPASVSAVPPKKNKKMFFDNIHPH